MSDEKYSLLKVEIDNIKEDIKEIKSDSKETNKHFREVIDALKENSIRQTEILNNQEKQFVKVNNDIAELKDDVEQNLKSQTKWYQDFLSNNFGLVFKVLVIIVLLLSGAKLAGLNVTKLLGL